MNDEKYFYDLYKESAERIVEEIRSVHPMLVTTFPIDDPLRIETIRFISEGGKRFRPTLSYLCAKFFGYDSIFPHLSLEVFHKYLLSHDDIIDRDKIRYGTPTVYKKMEESFPAIVEEDTLKKSHYGMSLGIISGDLMEASTYKIILQSDISSDTKVTLCSLVEQAVEDVVWGWYDQFRMDYLPLSSDAVTFDRITESIIWVTGKYTMKFPLYYGCALAGVHVPDGFDQLADDLGILFQTGDDLIGIFGNTEQTGKSNYGDIVQGKKTYPLYFAYQGGTHEEKELLLRLVGKKELTENEIEIVRNIVHTSGSYEKTKTLMREYRDACLEQIDVLAIPDDFKRFLRGFATYLENREK